MYCLAALISGLAMQALRPTLMATALCLSDLPLKPAIAVRLQTIIVTRDRRLLAPEVDSYGVAWGRSFLFLDEYGQTQPPVSDCILRETAIAPLRLFEPVALEHAKSFAAKAQRFPRVLNTCRLEGHPAQ